MFSSQIKGIGSFSTFLINDHKNIEIVSFLIKPNPNPNDSTYVDIIGDVKNTQQFQVDFIRVSNRG